MAIKCKRTVGEIKGEQLGERVGKKVGEKVGEKTGKKEGESLGEIDKINLCQTSQKKSELALTFCSPFLKCVTQICPKLELYICWCHL